MANLINCRSCNKKISKEAETCPKCGSPTADKSTQIFGGIIIVAIILLMMFHCELGIPLGWFGDCSYR